MSICHTNRLTVHFRFSLLDSQNHTLTNGNINLWRSYILNF